MKTINYKMAPAHSANAYKKYYQEGIDPGDFIRAVLANDLMSAVKRADPSNIKCLVEHVAFVYEELPFVCSGNLERVSKWMRSGGSATYVNVSAPLSRPN